MKRYYSLLFICILVLSLGAGLAYYVFMRNSYHALHWAVYEADSTYEIKALLEAGVDPNRKAESDFNTRYKILRIPTFPYIDIIEQEAQFSKGTPLHVACTMQGRCVMNNDLQVEIASELINSGSDVNIRNSYGLSPLDIAASRMNWQLIELLLKAGADPYKTELVKMDDNVFYYTCPIISVIRTGDYFALEIILKHKPDIKELNRIRNWGDADFTILDFAIRKNLSGLVSEDIVKLLRKYGAKCLSEVNS